MYLIVGAGFLGAYVIKELQAASAGAVLAVGRAPALSLPGADYVQCDVTDPVQVRSLAQRLAGERLTVFWFAAMHDVDALYADPARGKKVNLEALQTFLRYFPEIEKFFFSSTDCVYGENPPGCAKLKETDPAVPINEYGRQKLAAEEIVRAAGFTAVRFSYMLGPSLLPKRHFYDRLCEKLTKGEPVEMIDGMVRSALSYQKAASLLVALSGLPTCRLPQTVNLCGDAALTKYRLGQMAAARCGASQALVVPIPEAEGQKFFRDRRASRLVMDNGLLKSLLGLTAIDPEV